MDVVNETIDWSRCVYVDAQIDDDLVTRLTPRIVLLRQECNLPITVAIDSVGGSLRSMDALLGLLTGPNQDGANGQIITVVTNKAYSAAATLLAMGSYAVALPHADILVHDVRYGGLRDVTPNSALDAAKQLQTSNERAALRLANSMFGRWMWNYLDLNKNFDRDSKRFSKRAEQFKANVDACQLPVQPTFRFDLAGFAVSLFARLSRDNEILVVEAMSQLGKWGGTMSMAKTIPKYRTNSDAGMLDGALALYGLFQANKANSPFGGASIEEDLTLFMTLAVTRLASTSSSSTLTNFERAIGDFALFKSIEDPKHLTTATKLMLRHKHVFFDSKTASDWDSLERDTRSEISSIAAPNVKAAWLLCVLVAREMLDGDHTLTPKEALCLGLVDEIPGEPEFESRRQVLRDAISRQDRSESQRIPVRRLRKRNWQSR